MERSTGYEIRHPLEVLAEALVEEWLSRTANAQVGL
jgi:hypothetical protein